MTGIQALERKYPTKEVQPDSVEKREFEYIRHGTTSLIAFLEVSSGKIVHEYMNTTRTEADFEQAVRDMIMQDPQGSWVIVSDRLNTHQSESLVRLVAEHEELNEEL
jgi:hypothetical protein